MPIRGNCLCEAIASQTRICAPQQAHSPVGPGSRHLSLAIVRNSGPLTGKSSSSQGQHVRAVPKPPTTNLQRRLRYAIAERLPIYSAGTKRCFPILA